MLCAAALFCGCACGWSADTDAPAREPRPDAAQAVQEGNVEQWLQHYQRERGAEWERARTSAPSAQGSAEDAGVPAAAPGRRPERE